MSRLPKLPIVGVFLLLLAALPAAAQTRTVEGTWFVTQGLDLGLASGKAEAQPAIAWELLHLDADTEVREQSSLFQAGACGRESWLAFGLPMRIPFTASAGIGHWTFADDRVKVASYHLLYDCSGNALGVAWSVRDAKAVYETLPAPAGSEEPVRQVVAWEGEATISFFTLAGEPLSLPLFMMPILPGTDVGVRRRSGPFAGVGQAAAAAFAEESPGSRGEGAR